MRKKITETIITKLSCTSAVGPLRFEGETDFIDNKVKLIRIEYKKGFLKAWVNKRLKVTEDYSILESLDRSPTLEEIQLKLVENEIHFHPSCYLSRIFYHHVRALEDEDE